MSITTFRLAREQEEAKLKAGAEPAACPAPEPVEEAVPEPKKVVVSAPKAKTTTVKG
jgi:hypothetical protein